MLSEVFRKARFEEGRKEGRLVERKQWQAWEVELAKWESRRDQARQEGQPFNEPRPKPPVD